MATTCYTKITVPGSLTARSCRAALPGRILAAPSWVMPGSIAENCAFLATVVDEVGLLFLESAACLAYDSQDLPEVLADPPLSCHLHLPLDLPMEDPARAVAICAGLLDKAAHLPVGAHWQKTASGNTTMLPRQGCKDSRDCPGQAAPDARGGTMRAVLHPPGHDPADSGRAGRLLAAFAEKWLSAGWAPSQLLLENVRGNDLTGLAGQIQEYGFGLCLDMGHVLAYGQKKLLHSPCLLQRVQMLHVSAPGTGQRAGEHLPLTTLDAGQEREAARICQCVPGDAVIMMELFSWRHIEDSLPLIRRWL